MHKICCTSWAPLSAIYIISMLSAFVFFIGSQPFSGLWTVDNVLFPCLMPIKIFPPFWFGLNSILEYFWIKCKWGKIKSQSAFTFCLRTWTKTHRRLNLGRMFNVLIFICWSVSANYNISKQTVLHHIGYTYRAF